MRAHLRSTTSARDRRLTENSRLHPTDDCELPTLDWLGLMLGWFETRLQ